MKILEQSGLISKEDINLVNKKKIRERLWSESEILSLNTTNVKMEDLWRVDPKLAMEATLFADENGDVSLADIPA